jgi:small neutral amino acid transporter SnatA (MarC family)
MTNKRQFSPPPRQRHADKYIFLVCLACALALFIGGFFCPPMGVIDGSVLKAGGILALMQAIAIVGQNLANGKDVIFKKDDIEIKVGDEEDDKG